MSATWAVRWNVPFLCCITQDFPVYILSTVVKFHFFWKLGMWKKWSVKLSNKIRVRKNGITLYTLQLVELSKCTCTFELSDDMCYKTQEGSSLGTSTTLIYCVSSSPSLCRLDICNPLEHLSIGWAFFEIQTVCEWKNVNYLSALLLVQFQQSGFQCGVQIFVKT